jgi:hypothetical protein
MITVVHLLFMNRISVFVHMLIAHFHARSYVRLLVHVETDTNARVRLALRPSLNVYQKSVKAKSLIV